ncbi:NnrS family protein [Pseudomonas sp. S60]|uniref:NnrS family protein n=1 Tax=Pseudomonas sp. S60 TaxID=211124 RepID=UPI001911551D|nr:NnrS family protein [Pseudomonas sp. S60]MBK5012208.1 NnrS family protein [Pseudomonas sp. S60]
MLVPLMESRRCRPLWNLAYRPFFLAGTVFALIAVMIWAGTLAGVSAPVPTGGMLAWHRHEMLYGFTAAIVGGFLLTAVQNWSGLPGLHGRSLQALFLIWLLGRAAWFLALPVEWLVVIEGGFLPLVTLALARPIVQRRLRNNYPIVVLVLVFTGCQWLTLAGFLRQDEPLQRQGVLAGLWLVAAMMTVLGGRVIPFFTQRGLGNMTASTPRPWLDRSCLVLSVTAALAMAAGFGQAPQWGLAVLFGCLFALHAARLLLWHDRRLWGIPLLWSLHLAYAWLAVATLGMALWHAGVNVSPSLVIHALTVGAMSGLMLAMMARVSLGHTGRPLSVPASVAAGFALLHLAALARVILPLLTPLAFSLSALCWCMALLLFVRHYLPILLQPRADGLPG